MDTGMFANAQANFQQSRSEQAGADPKSKRQDQGSGTLSD